jgi:hypothetical protein
MKLPERAAVVAATPTRREWSLPLRPDGPQAGKFPGRPYPHRRAETDPTPSLAPQGVDLPRKP